MKLEVGWLFKILAAPIGVTMVGFLMVGKLVWPRVGEIRSKLGQIQTVERQEKIWTERKNYLLMFDEEELKKKAELVEKALLKENDAYYLVNIIRQIAQKQEFTIQSFSVSIGQLSGEGKKEERAGGEVKIPVTLSLIGPKERYLELVKALERNLPILAIDKFEQRNAATGLTELELAVSSYYLGGMEKLSADKLVKADLTLKKEELEAIERLVEFESVAGGEGLLGKEGREFRKFERGNPFGL